VLHIGFQRNLLQGKTVVMLFKMLYTDTNSFVLLTGLLSVSS